MGPNYPTLHPARAAPHRAARGFTLVELLVTLAVAAILAMIALPNLRVYVQNGRRDSLIDGLVAALHYARNQALSLDQVATVCAGTTVATGTTCPGGAWKSGWQVITVPAGAAAARTLTARALAANSVDTQTTLTPLNGNTSVAFNNLGLATFGTGVSETFVVCDSRGPAQARAVAVNSTGFIQASPTAGTAPNGTPLTCPAS